MLFTKSGGFSTVHTYDGGGNRISKAVAVDGSTWYVRDEIVYGDQSIQVAFLFTKIKIPHSAVCQMRD
jgi:hypothetical protein